ncbi:MAG: bifunctional riboflavin kinase/FAD synthetase [Pleurocapsa sp. MO_192.B19]|nr:bifunctional riboflavin kinase/FAD synthetase [Pleurocapsa sp. MO_192.B19]
MLVASSIEQIRTPTAIALGNFDGIHRGHQSVLQPIIDSFQSLQQPHVYPSVVSFTPHPREFFTGGKLQLLTPVAEKVEQLSSLGIEQLILLQFNRDLASLSPQQFVEQILVRQLQASQITVGSDFRFGYQRKGTGKDLKNIASGFGITVHLNSLHKCQDRNNQAVRVSSSLIRQALLDGEITAANTMLGRPYSLTGKVVTGQQLGRTIGFPTANLELPPDKFLPRYGVYSVDVLVSQTVVKGVMNIGCRPTVAGEAPTIEVHLLNWSGDLYGQTIKVNLLKFLRPEQKFSSVEALKQQIAKDCQAVLNNL